MMSEKTGYTEIKFFNFKIFQLSTFSTLKLTKTLGSSGITVLLSSEDNCFSDILSGSDFSFANSPNGLESIDGSFSEWPIGSSGEASVGREVAARCSVTDADFTSEKLKTKCRKDTISTFVKLIKNFKKLHTL